MASGDLVVRLLEQASPGASFANLDVRVGGSTPAENFTKVAFPDDAITYVDFKAYMTGYGAGGLTFTIFWAADTATTGTVRWEIAVRRIADDAEDLDVSHTYVFNNIDVSPASAAGEVAYDTLAFTDGADMDLWANNEIAWVRLRRDNTVGGNMTGDAQLFLLIGKET